MMPSSEPNWVTVKDGSDKDYRLISMYELQKLEYAINEECVGKNDGCPPGHLKEMHDSGNEVIDKVRLRPPAQNTAGQKIIFSQVYQHPLNYPSIINRKLAYKDFEDDGGESWCSISNSPYLKNGDIIQILRQNKEK